MTRVDYRMICAVDGSAGSDRALALIAALPIRPHDEVVVASRPAHLFANTGTEGIAARANASARDRAHVAVDAAVAHLAASGVRARSVICDGEDAVDALLRLAEREDAASLSSDHADEERGRASCSAVLLARSRSRVPSRC